MTPKHPKKRHLELVWLPVPEVPIPQFCLRRLKKPANRGNCLLPMHWEMPANQDFRIFLLCRTPANSDRLLFRERTPPAHWCRTFLVGHPIPVPPIKALERPNQASRPSRTKRSAPSWHGAPDQPAHHRPFDISDTSKA